MSRTSSTFGRQTTSRGLSSRLEGAMSNPFRRYRSASSSRKGMSNMAASFNVNQASIRECNHNSAELDCIEAEYIKNLQQQVYFLELEANFLDQACKATEMKPQMTSETERLLHKLRMMQSDCDDLHVDVRRKEANIQTLTMEKEKQCTKHRALEETHQCEKRQLIDEVVKVKKEKDLLLHDMSRKESMMRSRQDELTKIRQEAHDADTRLVVLRKTLDMKSDELQAAKQELEEKRADLRQAECKLRESEVTFQGRLSSMQDGATADLRDEVCILKQRLTEAELIVEQDGFLRKKLSEDAARLRKENSLLKQQWNNIESQEDQRKQNITETVVLRERERQLQRELSQARDLLSREQQHTKELVAKLTLINQEKTAHDLTASTTHSRLCELEALYNRADKENTQLRRDKMLLVDHVACLQRKLEQNELELSELHTKVHEESAHLEALDRCKENEMTLQSQKWSEFSRLAENMKNLSQSMAYRNNCSTSIEFA